MTEPTDAEQYLNVAGQCSATATSELAASILVDGGSGTLRQLLNDAADAIRAGWSTPQATQAQAGAVPLMYLPPLITAQINHLRNTAYRDGADGEPTGLLDKVHERLGAIILTELNKARQQSTPAHGIKGGQHGAE